MSNVQIVSILLLVAIFVQSYWKEILVFIDEVSENVKEGIEKEEQDMEPEKKNDETEPVEPTALEAIRL